MNLNFFVGKIRIDFCRFKMSFFRYEDVIKERDVIFRVMKFRDYLFVDMN